MFKRLFWFGSGAATGAAGSVWVRRRVQARLRRFIPGGLGEQVVDRLRRVGVDVSIASAEAKTLLRRYRDQLEQH